MYEVVKVNPLNDYRLLLEFNNGEQRIKDMKPLVDKPVFRILKDVSYFNSVKIAFGAITWLDKDGDSIDLCPDSTYKTGTPIN